VRSLVTLLGGRAPLLVETPEAAAGIELESFFLFPSPLDELAVVRLDATVDSGEGLAAACARLGDAAEAAVREGQGILPISDAEASAERPPVPMLLATSVVDHRPVSDGLRTLATLLVSSDEPREVHHVACLLGFGAEAVCPRLALQTVAALAEADRIGGDRPSPAAHHYRDFAELVNGRASMEVRDLLELRAPAEPVPLDEVEPPEGIVRRLSGGGMSHGALSAEAHETIAIAFNNLGARSNCGEGGEDPARFRTDWNSRIKQVPSGRFGVSAA
jgi:hypothetical protein